MTADGDDHDVENDAMMRSMRSVWLDMREENPPSRGFSELMAAARVKAVEMKPEPWWRRAFASLVRPPMLAAATVVVLVGSTVVLTRRAGTDAVPNPVKESIVERPRDAQKQAARDPAPDRFGESDDRESANQPAGIGGGSAPVHAPVLRPRPGIVKPDPAKDFKPAPSPEPPPDEPPKATGGDLGIKRPQDGPANGEAKKIDEHTQEEAPTTDAVRVDKVDSNITNAPTAVRPPTAGKPPTIAAEQLLKQAETAATRKDCPAVRATVERLKRLDDKLYKARAVTQPAIKRCL